MLCCRTPCSADLGASSASLDSAVPLCTVLEATFWSRHESVSRIFVCECLRACGRTSPGQFPAVIPHCTHKQSLSRTG
jgi:hypothetical protein